MIDKLNCQCLRFDLPKGAIDPIAPSRKTLMANTSVVCGSNTNNIKSATILEQSTSLAIRADMRGREGSSPG